MTNHLVMFNGEWKICRPAAMIDNTNTCHDCSGLGVRPGARKACPTCNGTGRVSLAPSAHYYRLCWVVAETGVFRCWDYDQPVVVPLPDVD